MMGLKDMIARGKQAVGLAPKPGTMSSIRTSRLDGIKYDDLRQSIPGLDELAHDLNNEHANTGELVRDAYHAFFKGAPELEDESAMDPRALVNRAVMSAVLDFPDTAATRERTQYSTYGSALATLALEDKLDSELRDAEEVRKASEEAAKAEQEARDAADAAADAAERLEAATPDPDAHGPLTEEQDALSKTLDNLLGQLDDRGTKVAETRDSASQAANALQRKVRGKAREAVQETLTKLEGEDELFRMWGIEPGEVSRMSFAERQALVQKLEHQKLSKFRKLIGRYRMAASAERAHKVQYGRDEVYDITYGKNLPDVLPYEFGALANRYTRLGFLQRFGQGQLVQRAWRGVERVGQGAVICLLDTSSSMKATDVSGIPREVWAKAVAMSMLDQAHAAKRDFVVMNFASAHQQRVWTFPAGEPINVNDLLTWGEHMFNGGTDYENPLSLGIDILEAEYNRAGKQRGDILLLTDDECRVSPDWQKAYIDRKHKLAFRTFGITIGLQPGDTLSALCDDVRGISEFADPSVIGDLHRAI